MSAPVGKIYEGGRFTVTAEHIQAYAAATGDHASVYEGHDAVAPPMFHVRLLFPSMTMVADDPELALDKARLVHGEHAATFHGPLRPGDVVDCTAKLLEIVDKSSGQLIVSGLYAHVDGDLRVECRTSYFVRGPSSGKSKGKREPPPEPPPHDYEEAFDVPSDASYRYADASLDDNPIHVDPEYAVAAGLPDVILQGLCTMAMTLREAVRFGGGGDPRRLEYGSVRFSGFVRNGDRLTTRAWRQEDGSLALVTLGPSGRPVISNAVARFSA